MNVLLCGEIPCIEKGFSGPLLRIDTERKPKTFHAALLESTRNKDTCRNDSSKVGGHWPKSTMKGPGLFRSSRVVYVFRLGPVHY